LASLVSLAVFAVLVGSLVATSESSADSLATSVVVVPVDKSARF
jgi:hypothetical protein